MKNTIIGLIVLLAFGYGVYYFIQKASETTKVNKDQSSVVDNGEVLPVEPDGGIGDGADPLPEVIDETKTVIGQSADGNDLTAYHFGSGDTEILFVGGIHGGYSWNTALVAYELMDYLEANEDLVPENVKVTVIPVLNPDGLEKITGKLGEFSPADVKGNTAEGRFNSNNVDLNRNFDCEWKEKGTWQSKTVSGGSAPFSEPETAAVRDFIETRSPAAVIAWYSAAGGVYSSSCKNGVSAETKELTNLYAKASGYKAFEEFDYYAITGDMMNWLAKKGVPAISVLLTTHTDTEWSKNLKGIEAILNKYAQ